MRAKIAKQLATPMILSLSTQRLDYLGECTRFRSTTLNGTRVHSYRQIGDATSKLL
jgi:hypothetical protein